MKYDPNFGADDPEAFDARRIAMQAKLTADLYFFSRFSFKQSTGGTWQRNWHHQKICAALTRVFNGQCKRLIINIPPRYSKTELAVVNFIAWCMARVPDCEFIHCSYSGRLAANNSWKAREIVSSEWYQSYFPGTKLAYGSMAKDDWRTTVGGIVYSAGAAGTITGFGAGKMSRDTFGGAIIIDDPHKADEGNSDLVRQGVLDWYSGTIKSRTNNPEHTPIIVIMQRLHESDLSGWLLGGGSGEEWEHLVIPAMNDNDEPLWPQKHDLDALLVMKNSDAYVFAGQYMQVPAPIGGGIFKDDWWVYYNPAVLPEIKFKRIVQSWDTAFKAKETADFSVCTTWGETKDGEYWLLDLYKGKIEFPELKRMAASLFLKWKPNAVLVEDKASGQSLIQELKLPIDCDGQKVRIPINAIKVDTDKISRAFAVTPLVQAGIVRLPEAAAWLPSYISSMGTFPNAANDDDVDSTTQALNFFHHTKNSKGIIEFYRQEHERLMAAKGEQAA